MILNNTPHSDYTLENIYRDSITRLENLFAIYNDIYDLPCHIHEDKDVSPEGLEYAKKRRYFVILVLHTKEGDVCFQRSFDTGHLSMNLPGGSIRLEEADTIITAIKRVANRSFKNAKIADIAPIVSLTNRFYSTKGEVTEHFGFGIRALLLNDVQDIKDISSGTVYKGKFLKKFPDSQIPHPPARETYKIFKQWFKEKEYTTNTKEIDTQHNVMTRYFLHQKIFNPLIKLLSLVLGKNSIKNVKNILFNKIEISKNVIDVACGDDKSIFDLLSKVNRLIANDISIDQIGNMKQQYNARYHKLPKSNSLVFTNHDCLDLPFKDNAFDILICRNLLHHMNAAKDLPILLNNFKRISQKIIIMEIQDPKNENILGRIRHQYYMKFLKDEGTHFFSIEDFEKILRNEFKGNQIKFEYLSTIRGIYMLAEIDNCKLGTAPVNA
jgi:ubiquinone/menaquinone biosynthesis C-methylase UbiE